MNKFKTVCTVFLLLIITAGVVFVPQIVGKINEKAVIITTPIEKLDGRKLLEVI